MTSSNAEKRKGMPTAKAIRKHWAQWLVTAGKFDSIQQALNAKYCFACGFDAPGSGLQRAHILALADGGNNDVENLHMLCLFCHQSSEYISGEEYFAWFAQRNIMDRIIETCLKTANGTALVRQLMGMKQ